MSRMQNPTHNQGQHQTGNLLPKMWISNNGHNHTKYHERDTNTKTKLHRNQIQRNLENNQIYQKKGEKGENIVV